MDLFEFNKFAGAILATGLVIFAISETGNIIFESEPLEENAYPVEMIEEEAPAAETAAEAKDEAETAAAEPAGLGALLAAGDPEAGRKVAKKCGACHTFDQGGKHRVGPNLWDVVGAEQAGAEGYSYSGALKDLGGTWSYEELDAFLANPKGYVSGTKMSFTGVKDAQDRADLILFLRSFSDSPEPLP